MKKGPIYILLATLLFSSMEVALKGLAGSFNPIQITCTRFLAAGQRRKHPEEQDPEIGRASCRERV